MRFTWYGLSCFYIEGKKANVLTDPFDNSVGYTVPNVFADIWTCSHDHYDHNYRPAIRNDDVRKGRDGLCIGSVCTFCVRTFHDKIQGALWGENEIFIIEMDGLRIAHLGDLGHELNSEQLNSLGQIDVLLIPTGGIFTIDAKEAASVANAIDSRVVIPMHYYTPHVQGFDLEQGIDDFISLQDANVIFLDGNSLELPNIPTDSRTIYVFHLD
jgi:L-ascorbate metabolism protein UlaG (beta-lactamase superfamily)